MKFDCQHLKVYQYDKKENYKPPSLFQLNIDKDKIYATLCMITPMLSNTCNICLNKSRVTTAKKITKQLHKAPTKSWKFLGI